MEKVLFVCYKKIILYLEKEDKLIFKGQLALFFELLNGCRGPPIHSKLRIWVNRRFFILDNNQDDIKNSVNRFKKYITFIIINSAIN